MTKNNPYQLTSGAELYYVTYKDGKEVKRELVTWDNIPSGLLSRADISDRIKLVSIVNKYGRGAWGRYISVKTNQDAVTLELTINSAKEFIKNVTPGELIFYGHKHAELIHLIKTFESLSVHSKTIDQVIAANRAADEKSRKESDSIRRVIRLDAKWSDLLDEDYDKYIIFNNRRKLKMYISKYELSIWKKFFNKHAESHRYIPDFYNLRIAVKNGKNFINTVTVSDLRKYSHKQTYLRSLVKTFRESYFNSFSGPPSEGLMHLLLKKKRPWPEIWNTGGEVQNFVLGDTNVLNPCLINVYVTRDEFFTANFGKLNIEYTGEKLEGDKNRNYDFDTYTASLYAAYVTTYLCGISTEHLEYKPSVPRVITSIARYHLFFHMKKFIANPVKLRPYVTSAITRIINSNRPKRKVWEERSGNYKSEDKFYKQYGRENVILLTITDKVTHNLEGFSNERIVTKDITYKFRIGWDNGPDYVDNYKMFVARNSNGLTGVGELLMLQTIESYVYSVLGAQAQTKSPIVGITGQSNRTQEIFKILANDTIITDDLVLSKNNMETAIVSTKVIQNVAMFPGLPLIPDRLIILTEVIQGYNNIEKVAKKSQGFGPNPLTNFQGVPKKKTMQNIGRGDDLTPIDKSEDDDEPKGDGNEGLSPIGQESKTQPSAISENPELGTALYVSGISGVLTYIALLGIL